MKTIFTLFIALYFFCSCNDTKPRKEKKNVITESENFEELNGKIERRLSYEKEKIILLSEARKIPFDTVNLILRDYYVAIDTVLSSDENSKQLFQSAIVKISTRYEISTAKVASLIFSYKYEMLTKEDIEESAIEDFIDNYEEQAPEPEDPY